jgi:hypothetical protein
VWRTWLARSPTMSPWTAHHTATSSTICPSTACCPGVLAPSSVGATPRGALAHRRVCHPKLPGRGRRERGRVWGGKAAGSAETETDLLLVRDAGGGHGVGETDSKAGAPTIYAVALWLRALAAAKAGEGNWEWVPVRLFLVRCGHVAGAGQSPVGTEASRCFLPIACFV